MTENNMSPEIKKAVRDVQKGFAQARRNRALQSIRKSIESNYDVADVVRERNGLTVAMMDGVVLRIEQVR